MLNAFSYYQATLSETSKAEFSFYSSFPQLISPSVTYSTFPLLQFGYICSGCTACQLFSLCKSVKHKLLRAGSYISLLF